MDVVAIGRGAVNGRGAQDSMDHQAREGGIGWLRRQNRRERRTWCIVSGW